MDLRYPITVATDEDVQWLWDSSPLSQKQAVMAATVKHIRDLYDAGTPPFNRNTLQDLAYQLQKYREGTLAYGRFFLVGIDGVGVHFDVDADQPLADDDDTASETIW
jgi:hypothetical protein